ncbi:MAG: hypothetical protein LBO04_05720 [Spirochaetaceae bacterium]|jgi:hypothetical protein|nr:hypothetical protein [Spirochaetaceae bacterium]
MKFDKRIFSEMTVMVLLCGFVLAGCSTTKYIQTETETTKIIYEAASELVRSREGGITAGALISGLGNKFSGLKSASFLAIQVDLITVNYQGTNYMIKCIMDSGETVRGTGSSVSMVGETTVVTSIVSVYTLIEDPDQSTQ